MRRSLRDRVHLIPTVAPGAPQRGPRNGPTSGNHRNAALGVLLAFTGVVALGLAMIAEAGRPHPMVGKPLPPLDLSAGRACTGNHPAGGAPGSFGPPGVIIYISVHCPHCRAQLEAWDHLLAEWKGPAPWVVIAPGEEPDSGVIPPRMRGRVVLDDGARIARLLDVERVPMTVYVATDRRVIARVEGRQGGAEMTRLLSESGLVPPFLSPPICP